MLLDRGLKSYTFTYKPGIVKGPKNSLDGEQFLLVDFENFEIRDKVPNLPSIVISYVKNAYS
jgi:hypothetical protein